MINQELLKEFESELISQIQCITNAIKENDFQKAKKCIKKAKIHLKIFREIIDAYGDEE